MKDSGVAIMGSGLANGENRAIRSIEMALNSPLLNDNNIEGANNLLLYIASGKDEITMDEVSEITDYIQEKTKNSAEVIWGNGIDESLEDNISVTIIATGFDEEHKRKPAQPEKAVIVKNLYEQEVTIRPLEAPVIPQEEPVSMIKQEAEPEPAEEIMTSISEPVALHEPEPESEPEPEKEQEVDSKPECRFYEKKSNPEETYPHRTIVFNMEPRDTEPRKIITEEPAEEKVQENKEVDVPVSEVLYRPNARPVQKPEPDVQKAQPEMEKMMNERVQKLRALSEKLKTHPPLETHLAEIESIPAYKRRNVELSDVQPSSVSQVQLYTVSENDKNVELIKKENSYLNNNVD